jgi:protein O-mannosyl-transferase
LIPGKKNIAHKRTPIRRDTENKWVDTVIYYSGKKYFFPVVIFLLCFLLYGNSILNDYALDDGLVTYSNEFVVKGFSAFKEIFSQGSLYGWSKTQYIQQAPYRPLPLLSFMEEVSIFGLNPHVSHFFNVLFFAFTVVILYYFLQRILSPKDVSLKKYNPAIIVTATLLFAFHPIHTEVVANIKSRDEILSLLFGLISFHFIILHQQEKKTSYYLYSLTAFFASLFCKESAVAFLAIIPLILYFFTSIELKKIALKTIPFVLLVGVYLLIRIHVLQSTTLTSKLTVMDNALMAAGNNAGKIATSIVILGKYIFMTIVPYPLSFDYSYNQIPVVSWGNIKPLLSLLVCVILIGYMFLAARKKSIFSFLIAFFFITIFLSSNLVIRFACTFAERFLYTPSLSFCMALPILYAKALKLNILKSDWKKDIKFYIPFTFLLIICGVIVIQRNSVWKNNVTLFSSGVVTSPNSGLTHTLLGGLYLDSAESSANPGRRPAYYNLAIYEYKKAIGIYPAYPNWYYNLGICYNGKGNGDSAIIAYKKTLSADPNYFMAANNLGVLYMNKALYDSAISYFSTAYKADTNLYTLLNIATSCQDEKNFGLAIHYDSLALIKAPGNKDILVNLSYLETETGIQYLNNNEFNKAIEKFSNALKYDSNSFVNIENIGVVYSKMGNTEAAKTYYLRALYKDPGNETFKSNLKLLDTGKRK